MKLLLDENLSRRLLPLLIDAFPGSTHVVIEGLQQADDAAVWQFAKKVLQVLLAQRDEIGARFADPEVAMVELIYDMR